MYMEVRGGEQELNWAVLKKIELLLCIGRSVTLHLGCRHEGCCYAGPFELVFSDLFFFLFLGKPAVFLSHSVVGASYLKGKG